MMGLKVWSKECVVNTSFILLKKIMGIHLNLTFFTICIKIYNITMYKKSFI